MKKHIVFFVMLCLMLGIVVGCQDNTQVVNLYLDDDGDTTTLYSDPADGNSGSSGGQGSSGNQGTEESSYLCTLLFPSLFFWFILYPFPFISSLLKFLL